MRGEELPLDEAPVDDLLIEDEVEDDAVAIDDEILADDTAEPEVDTAPQVVSRPTQEESIVDTILGYLTNFWVLDWRRAGRDCWNSVLVHASRSQT